MLGDFGLAKFINRTGHKSTGAAAESNSYLPPEIRPNQVLGPESDVWSVGCILLDALTYSLKGYKGFQEFQRQRTVTSVIQNRKTTSKKFHEHGKESLKPQVLLWMTQLEDENLNQRNRFDTTRYIALVKEMLLPVAQRKMNDMRYFEHKFGKLFKEWQPSFWGQSEPQRIPSPILFVNLLNSSPQPFCFKLTH